uniref:Cyclin-like domain-containing protein n=1 Tax=Fabrea salina TaxID=342563 RepID=A0A7S3MSG0_9CILI|mmetsp:Transcript_486/g.823  ORF Transcript_486/g.823 Transcript_486/m.823 type:complete len:247 (+) Transcript_486:1-741(+)
MKDNKPTVSKEKHKKRLLRSVRIPLADITYEQTPLKTLKSKESQNTSKEPLLKLRPKMIEWFVDICKFFELSPHCLMLAVNILDEVLTNSQATQDEFHLLGTAAMFLASKYQESTPISIESLLSTVLKNKFSRTEVLNAERLILVKVKFKLYRVSALHFIDTYCQELNFSEETRLKSISASVISTYFSESLNYKPSEIALASLAFSGENLGKVEPSALSFVKYAVDNFHTHFPSFFRVKKYLENPK